MIWNLISKAKDLFYKNTASGLASNDVQGAIDELKTGLDGKLDKTGGNMTGNLVITGQIGLKNSIPLVFLSGGTGAADSAIFKKDTTGLTLEVHRTNANYDSAILPFYVKARGGDYAPIYAGDVYTNNRNIDNALGNVGGINAKYFNRSSDTTFNSTITSANDIPIGYMGYVNTQMENVPVEGVIWCYGIGDYRVQVLDSLYGGGRYLRYDKNTAGWTAWKRIITSTEIPYKIVIDDNAKTINFIDL